MYSKISAVSVPQTAVLLFTTNNKPVFNNTAISFFYMTIVTQYAVCIINYCTAFLLAIICMCWTLVMLWEGIPLCIFLCQ